MSRAAQIDSNLREAIHAAVDGELTAAQIEQLEEGLRGNPSAARWYIDLFQLHADLDLIAHERRSLQACEALVVQLAASESSQHVEATPVITPALSPPASVGVPQSTGSRWVAAIQTPAGFAVFFTTVAFTSLLLFFAQIQLTGDRSPTASRPTTGSGDAWGCVTGEWGGVWAGPATPPAAGQDLPRERPLELVSGMTEIELYTGVKIVLEGPARFALRQANSIWVEQGQLRALVEDPRGHGFTVDTPHAQIIDRGTEFGVRVDPGEGISAEVFRGAVEIVRPLSPPQRVTAGQAVRITGAQLVALPPQSGQFRRSPGSELGVTSTSFNLRLLSRPPKSVAAKALVDRQQGVLFRERQHIVIDEALMVGIDRPGKYRADRMERGSHIAAGSHVDSFLLHIDPGGPSSTFQAAVTFEQPVLGILLADRMIYQSDARFGSPETRYEQAAHRGLEPGDIVTLSDDRRTVILQLTASLRDHIRILVQSANRTNAAEESQLPRPSSEGEP